MVSDLPSGSVALSRFSFLKTGRMETGTPSSSSRFKVQASRFALALTSEDSLFCPTNHNHTHDPHDHDDYGLYQQKEFLLCVQE